MAKHREYRWQGFGQQQPPGELTKRSVEPRPSEPMTERQAVYLATLCEQAKLRFDPTWSKARATREITRMKKLNRRYRIKGP